MYLNFPGCLPQAFETSKSTGAGGQGPPPRHCHGPATQPEPNLEAAPALTSLALCHPSFPQGAWKERPLFPFRRTSWRGEERRGEERRCRRQCLATWWLGARTRSSEIDTANNFCFRFSTLSGYMKIRQRDPKCEDLL